MLASNRQHVAEKHYQLRFWVARGSLDWGHGGRRVMHHAGIGPVGPDCRFSNPLTAIQAHVGRGLAAINIEYSPTGPCDAFHCS